jgi:hypothetical protein
MTETHFRDGKSEAQRIADRLKPSNSPNAVMTKVQTGTGPTRVIHTTYHAGHQGRHQQGKSVTDLPVVPTGGGSILGQKGE